MADAGATTNITITVTNPVLDRNPTAPSYDDVAMFRTEYFKRCCCPFCCITLGSDLTTVTKSALGIRRNDTCW